MCVETPGQPSAPKCYQYSITKDSKSTLSLDRKHLKIYTHFGLQKLSVVAVLDQLLLHSLQTGETYSCSVCEGGDVSCPPADQLKMLLSLQSGERVQWVLIIGLNSQSVVVLSIDR